MKYIRAAVVALVIALSVWLAVPGLLTSEQADENTVVETTSTAVPAPTPDYKDIEPPVTATPEPTAAVASRATPAPARTASNAEYVLDLWLDGSPNIAGISPFDSETNRGSNYGQWAGGFFYRSSSKGDETNQQGWLPSLLNLLYSKDAAGWGSVRVLRFCAESMLSQEELNELKTTYRLNDVSALVRDTLTYSVLPSTEGNYLSFFEELLQTKGDLKPGGSNPYAIQDCFYTPNEESTNNRTTYDESDRDEREWNWQRETANTEALAHADQMVSDAFARYQRQLDSGVTNTSSPEASDYLYYALNAMDASRLNVVVVDTIGLPEIDHHSHLYSQRIDEMTRQNGGDLAVGLMVFQLDYAGKISTIAGRSLENGFLWGYENFYYGGKVRNSSLRWSYVQPMPRPLTMLVIGPSAQVNNYTSVLSQWLDREMRAGGQFSATRGTVGGKLPETSTLDDSFFFNGVSYKAPEFGFKYQCTVMEYKDVVAEQRSLMSTLSDRLAQNGAQLRFDTETETLANELYNYVTTVGNTTVEQDVPVITASLSEDVTIAVDLSLQNGDSFTVTDGQYDSGVTVVSALETQSFTLEEIDVLSRNGGLDLSEDSDILQDQAYIDEEGRIYKYHLTDGSGLKLNVTTPAVVDGELQVVISTDEVPAPGYYWVTLEMRSKTLAELDNASWNAIQFWMLPDTTATGFDPVDGPAVLASRRYSWDFTPDSRILNSYSDQDGRLTASDNAIAFIDGEHKGRLHHAWGARGSEAATASTTFPANIPPVFRAFQLNRIAQSVRGGLLDRSGAMDSASFLTRHFIICVPEPTTAGEV